MKLMHGDCLDRLRELPDCSVDAVVTDPPYGLSFMGKKWDYDVPSVEAWAECFRVLKPGGHLLAFAGTRTQHRMAVRIEDAGFEIRDMIAWVYGSGFPKSHNLKGDWQGWGTALKPAMEPITVARKPLIGTVAENVMQYGTGAINVDECRVEVTQSDAETSIKRTGYKNGANHVSKPRNIGEKWDGWGMASRENSTLSFIKTGRWPANFIHDGSEDVVGLFPNVHGGGNKDGNGRRNLNAKNQNNSFFSGLKEIQGQNNYADCGSAARFFYCAKASKADRDDGANRNEHPTVKPTALMRYLVRLVTPPGGTVLDPFMGSGSTGKAAKIEGFNFIGIEREAEYIKIAEARIASAKSELKQGELF